jgi:hypothetical protein
VKASCEGIEGLEKDEHRDTENTEEHREETKIFMEKAKTEAKTSFSF